jgi:chromosome segregation ATPase
MYQSRGITGRAASSVYRKSIPVLLAQNRSYVSRHFDDRLRNTELQLSALRPTVEYLRIHQDSIRDEMYGRFDKVDSTITRLENKIDTRFGVLESKISEISKESKDIHSAMHRVEYELRAQREHADKARKEDLQKTRIHIAAFGVVVAVSSLFLSQFKK